MKPSAVLISDLLSGEDGDIVMCSSCDLDAAYKTPKCALCLDCCLREKRGKYKGHSGWRVGF